MKKYNIKYVLFLIVAKLCAENGQQLEINSVEAGLVENCTLDAQAVRGLCNKNINFLLNAVTVLQNQVAIIQQQLAILNNAETLILCGAFTGGLCPKIIRGSGFKVVTSDSITFKISFDDPFAAPPVVLGMPDASINSIFTPLRNGVTASFAIMKLANGNATSVNNVLSFIACGTAGFSSSLVGTLRDLLATGGD